MHHPGKIKWSYILVCCLALAVKAVAQQAPFTDTTLLFEPGHDGYSIIHVPALLMSKKGTLLAFAEGRYGTGNDWAEIDLIMRRSTDGGKTWSPVTVLIPRTPGKPTSNITPIADRNGTIHLLYQVNYANAYYMKSTDEGKTWSTPADITYVFEQFRPEYNWKVLAPGPGHAIQLKSGRIVVPVWMCIPDRSKPGGDHRPSCTATIYSDDGAKTWKRGDIICNNGDRSASGDTIINPNESVLIELTDGRVMINMRNESLLNRRLVSYSPDGVTHWTKPAFDTALFEPVCMASLIRVSGGKGKKNRIIFVNPDSRARDEVIRKNMKVYRHRENLTAKLSYDEGKTWPVQKVLHAAGSGYSDLAVGRDGTIYCLYEIRNGGDNDWKYRVVIRRFNLEWLTGGEDHFK